jgi:hypothetical protein
MESNGGKEGAAGARPSPSLWAAVRVGVPEVLFLLALGGWAVTRFVSAPVSMELILLLVALGAGAVTLVRLVRGVVRPLLWKLRNRLIVAYIAAVLPIAILLLLARYGTSFLGGQIGVFLVQNELERRLDALESASSMLVRVQPDRRHAALERIEPF